ncbi:AMP-binding enzyme [Actinomycetospora sp. CA-101289]|uniref:AMP-binding enzyme n=1 Tax=Actinomycetospora sp. CA-101289 TaxID=3239893 RepID=UPI003D95E27E
MRRGAPGRTARWWTRPTLLTRASAAWTSTRASGPGDAGRAVASRATHSARYARCERRSASRSGASRWASCAVIGVPDDDWGERVHAVVVPAAGAAPTAEELREHVKSLIAGYKAPRTVELRDALPISGAGEILKRELRAEHWPVRRPRGVVTPRRVRPRGGGASVRPNVPRPRNIPTPEHRPRTDDPSRAPGTRHEATPARHPRGGPGPGRGARHRVRPGRPRAPARRADERQRPDSQDARDARDALARGDARRAEGKTLAAQSNLGDAAELATMTTVTWGVVGVALVGAVAVGVGLRRTRGALTADATPRPVPRDAADATVALAAVPRPPDPPPGWYRDARGAQRWYDGRQWTPHVR